MLTRRRKPGLLLAAVTAVLAATILAPSAAASEQAAAARSIVRDMIVSPKQEAFIKRPQARASFNVPAGTNRLWVRLNNRSIAARFSRSGSLRIATLSLQSGLRYGQNTLFVLAKRSGRRRPVADSHSFVIGRRVQGLARLKMTPGPVTLVDLRAAAPGLTPSVFDSRWLFRKRLNGVRRDREARIRFNGRPVTEFFSRPQPTRWKTRLSATHGLRHGVNRLRILLLEPESGRYEVLRRRFTVAPNVPLPAAGLDLGRPFGLDRMPLDASDSLSGGGPLDYSWQLLSKRKGSDPALRGADSATALFDPDRPGRYRAGLQVAGAQSTAMDTADLVVGPREMLPPFTGLVQPQGGGRSGIQIGDKLYPHPRDPEEGAIQWLTLDRATLTPIKTKNNWVGATAGGGHGIDELAKALAKGGKGDLVILSSPLGGTGTRQVNPNQVDDFNNALRLLGIAPRDADTLTRTAQRFAAVGIPYGGEGSGYYQQMDDDAPYGLLEGWLMPDGVERSPGVPNFRFQPEKVEFDTSAQQPNPTQNQMKLGEQTALGSLDTPATGAFQVVPINPATFEPTDPDASTTFNTHWPAQFGPNRGAEVALQERQRMAQLLRDGAKRGELVAVQSIGNVNHEPPAGTTDQERADLEKSWRELTEAMQATGANPHTFYTADDSYAYIGGAPLERAETAESSTAIETDPTREPPLREDGSVQGFGSIRSDGIAKPGVADGSDTLQFEVYDIAFRKATPWPFAPETGHPEAAQYRRALAYISTCVRAFEGWGPDLRSAYAGDLDLDYAAATAGLDRQPYPDDVPDPKTCPAWNFSEPPGFTRFQYGVLHAELDQEMLWLASVEKLFNSAERALSRSGGKQLVDLKGLSDRIQDGVRPSNSAEIGLEIGEFFLHFFEVLAELTESAATLGFVEAVAAVYEITSAIASDTETGLPLGDQVEKKADELALAAAERLDASASGLDRLRQVIISDYGRLRALGSVASGPAYAPDTSTMVARMNQGANQWFSSELLPVPYGVHALHLRDIVKGEATIDNCYITEPAGYDFSRAADSPFGQLKFFGDFSVDGYSPDWPTLLVIGLHDLHDAGDKTEYVPSKALAESIFRPDAQGGYGLQYHRFVWEKYDSPAPPTNIAICN